MAMAWQFKPLFTVLCCLVGWAYFYQLRRTAAVSFSKGCGFSAGLLLAIGLVSSPLDTLGQHNLIYLRMLEYMLLLYGVSALLLTGLPASWLSQLQQAPKSARRLQQLSHPVTAGLGMNLLFFCWHLPWFYNTALSYPWFNELQLFALIGIGIIMWLPLLSPLPSLCPPPGQQMFYIVSLVFWQIPLFGLLTFSQTLLYPSYVILPSIKHLGPLDQQILAGWLMKMFSTVVNAMALIPIFLRWNRDQRQQDHSENKLAFENIKLVKQASRREG